MEKEREEKLDLDEKVELVSDSDLDDKVGGSAVDDVLAGPLDDVLAGPPRWN